MADIDLLTVGRVNLDLYSQQIGVTFSACTGWDAMVGGSPANVAVAAARLGLNASLLSAVGTDLVGGWVLEALVRAGVGTSYVLRKDGPHTSLALRAQRPPDHPLAFYRHDPADIHLVHDDVQSTPLDSARILFVSADAFARGSTAELCRSIVLRPPVPGRPVYIDLDLREVNWADRSAYASAVGPMVEHADVVLGTADEFAALLRLDGDLDDAAIADAARQRFGRDGRVLVVKLGAHGAILIAGDTTVALSPYRVIEASTVGAGDSFAAGFVYSRLNGSAWETAAQFATACAALTVSRFGCSTGFPTLGEVRSLMQSDLAVRV